MSGAEWTGQRRLLRLLDCLGLAIALYLVAGCDTIKRNLRSAPEPVEFKCSAECYQPCDYLVLLPAWIPASPDGSGTANELRAFFKRDAEICGKPIDGVPSTNAQIRNQCENRRATCAACLINLQTNKVIK
jgi:hypothetical protein